MYAIAGEMLGPVDRGLTELKPGYHVENVAPEIVHVLNLLPAKGVSYYCGGEFR